MTVVCTFESFCEGDYIDLLLFVDDMLIASKIKGGDIYVKNHLDKWFETKKLGIANKLLSMEIKRKR